MPFYVVGPNGIEYGPYPDEMPEAEAIQRARTEAGEPVASGAVEDIWNQLLGGVGGVGAQTLGGILDVLEGAGPHLTPRPPGANPIADWLQQQGASLLRETQRRQSPELARDLSTPVEVDFSQGFPDISGLEWGDVLSTLSQSAPSTAAIIGTSALAGPSGGLATAASLEGTQSAGQSASSIEEEMRAIAAHEPEIFINSRLGQEALRAANNDYPTAVEIAVERASGIIPTLSGIGVGLLGSLGVNPARLFGASTARGLALRILTPIGRAAQEGILEELPQSALEQFTQNLAVSQVNPEQDLLEGVPGAGLLGAITGAFGGGAFGTVEALAGGRGRDPLEEEYVANLEAERDRLEAGYDQAEAILGALAPLQQPEQPSEPVAPPSRAPTPTAPPDTSGLDEALFALESSLEDGTDVERRQATSDLVDAMLAAGAPPEQVTEALESEESLIALAEALAASNQVSVQPSPEDDATEERQQDGQRPNEDQQELSPRQSYYRDLDRLEQAYRAREDAVDANNRESYEEAHGHLVEAAREIFGEDYVSSYQAALGHDLETNEGQNMPRIEADLADAVEQHLRDNDRLQETTSDVEPEGGIVQPQQERLAHTQEVEGATPSPAPTPAEPPAAVEPPSTQDQLEELEAVKPPPEPAAVTPPEAAAEQPPGPPPTMAEIQQLTEIEEPGDFNVAVAAKGWDPASLKALRDSLPVPDPNDLGEQANLYRTLGDAIQAARQAQKAKGRSTSAPRPRTTRGENDKGTEAPAVQSQSKPSGPKVKEVSQESLKRLQKALSDLETGGTQKIARYDEQGNKLGGAKIRVSGGAKDYQ